MTTGIPALAELWQRLESWLREHAPGDHGSLRPGCPTDEIKRLEDSLGFPLHEDVREILAMHNGAAVRRVGADPGAFLLGYSLLGVEGIMEAAICCS